MKKTQIWRLSPLLNRRLQPLNGNSFQLSLKRRWLPLMGMPSIHSLSSKNRNDSFLFLNEAGGKDCFKSESNQNSSGTAARCTDVTHRWSWESLIHYISTGHQCSCTVKCRIKMKATAKRTGKDKGWTEGPSTARALGWRAHWKKTRWPI